MSSSTTEAPTAVVDVTMPQLGVSVSEGTVVAWKVQVGDEVAYEQTICDVATDKIDIECPSPAAGTIAEILAAEDETVPVGTVIARIRPAGAEVPDPGDPLPPTPAPPHPGPPSPGDPVPAPRGAFISPVVQRICAQHGLDPRTLVGTGMRGRVTKKDALAAINAEPPLHIESPYRPEPVESADVGPAGRGENGFGAPPAAAPPVPRDVTAATASPPRPLSRMRRLIGQRMTESLRTAAHCTTIFEADMSAVERRRKEIGATYLPVVARCAIEALRRHPQLNAWLEDGARHTVHDAVHLGIAVDLGDEGGLVVPVIRDAHRLTDEGLAEAIRDLSARARGGALEPGELDGGTFTITNPGALGALAATPIINLPQVAILDLEAIVKRPVVISGPDGDAIAIRPMTNLCLSWDHRALDGAAAARFLATLRERLEHV